MTSIVYTKSYSAPPVDRREAIRYAGVRGDSPDAEAILAECISESENTLSFRLCYGEYPLTRVENLLDFGFARVESAKLSEHLLGCSSVIVVTATLGIGIDRLISKYSRLSQAKALMLQGLGAERIEALLDLFCEEQRREKTAHGMALTARFSAGYGDLSLEFQREIFKALDCERKIGLTLNDSLIMSPTKSVSAIIGIKKDEK